MIGEPTRVRVEFLTPEEINFNQDCDTDDESEYVEQKNEIFKPLAILLGNAHAEQQKTTGVPPPPPPHLSQKDDARTTKMSMDSKTDKEEGEINEGDEDENEQDEEEKYKNTDAEDKKSKDEDEKEQKDEDNNDEQEDDDDDDTSPEMYLFEKIILSPCIQSALLFKKRISKGVYLVKRLSDENLLCLKFVRRRSKYQSRMPMELRLLSHIRTFPKLRHVQKLEGVFITQSYYGFLSEYVPDLLRVTNIHQRPLEIREIIRQLLVGIRQLHRNGIIHRDIKMSNVLWSGKVLTIVDFDKGTWNTPQGHHVLVGTEGFLAPEVWRYERDGHRSPVPYKEKADIYSAGMLFGCLLFHVTEADAKEMHASIFRDDAHQYLPALTADILKKMLRFSPQKRASAHTLLQHRYFAK